MKVLIADKFEQSGIDALQAGGCEVLYQPDLKDASLAEALSSTKAEVLVVRSTKVTEAILEASQLALVVRAGAGYDTIDVRAASRRGIYVSNCPGKNSIAVAELAFGLILALDRRIPDNVAELRAGKWNKKEYSKARGLHGKTLGLLGFGSIGQEMAKRAQAFGMSVAVWSEIGVQVGKDGVPVDYPLMVRLRPASGAHRARRARRGGHPPSGEEAPAVLAAARDRDGGGPRDGRRRRRRDGRRARRRPGPGDVGVQPHPADALRGASCGRCPGDGVPRRRRRASGRGARSGRARCGRRACGAGRRQEDGDGGGGPCDEGGPRAHGPGGRAGPRGAASRRAQTGRPGRRA